MHIIVCFKTTPKEKKEGKPFKNQNSSLSQNTLYTFCEESVCVLQTKMNKKYSKEARTYESKIYLSEVSYDMYFW